MRLHRGAIELTLKVLVVVAASACGDEGDTGGGDGGSSVEVVCAMGEQARLDGTCAPPAGVPADLPCPPGEWLVDGACLPAGLTEEQCAEGFELADDGGCAAILPATKCPVGMMALPGETSCREVMPCGAAPWGDIPIETDTHYVDAAYPGNDSDGSAVKPWLTIADALTAVADGAIIAIAAGTYDESVYVVDRPLRIWGRCPSMVTITGGSQVGVLFGGPGADGGELHGVTVSNATIGAGLGVAAVDSGSIRVDRVHVIDTTDIGVYAQSTEPTQLTLQGSLVERNYQANAASLGADLIVEDSLLRDSYVDAAGFAIGVVAQTDADGFATLQLRRSLLEGNTGVAVFLTGADGNLEQTLIRDVKLGTEWGRGIAAQSDPTGTYTSSVAMSDLVFERTIESAVFQSSGTLSADRTTIRAVGPSPFDEGGGVAVGNDPWSTTPVEATLRSALITGYHSYAVYVANATLDAESLLARDAAATPVKGSAGIVTASEVSLEQPTRLTLRGSAVVAVNGVGIFLGGGEAEIDGVLVRDVQVDAEGLFGRGISSRPGYDGVSGNAIVRHTVVRDVHEMGIYAGSIMSVEASEVANVSMDALGNFGDGITAFSFDGSPVELTLRTTRVSNASRGGVVSISAHVALFGMRIDCHAIDLVTAVYQGVPVSLDDQGGNECGCDTPELCKAVGDALEPPAALDPAPAGPSR